MPPRQSVPRIRVDSPDSSPRSLSPSSTLDIRDILNQTKLLPQLLAENLVLDDADLYWEDGDLQEIPPFPVGHRPPLFILDCYRARLPFHIRPDAFEMGDFCWDEGAEDACPLLTAPTIPRMKLMMKEQLHVQKWVDHLTPDHPLKHIPWTCDKPAMERKWIAEGSIFPVATVKSSTESRGVIQEHSRVTDKTRFSAVTSQMPHSEESYAFSEASPPFHVSIGSHTSTSHVLVKSADVDPGTLRGESKTSQARQHIVRISHASSPPTLSLSASGPPPGTTSTPPDAPLAVRRGKPLSGLKLKGSVIEQLEYPDIPTAFRGSPSVWSPRFEAFPAPSFTDHEKMLSDLKSKCAALGSAVSMYTQETPRPQTEMTRTTPSVDEWSFTRELAAFDDFLGSIDSQLPKEIIADTSIFLPGDTSTPAKHTSFTAHLGFIPLHHPPPALQSPIHHSSDPPGVPLPPRPALIHPSTPPHVRGILKKVKSVRFEDTIIKEPQNRTSLAVPPPPPGRPSPLPLTVSERSSTLMPNIPKPSSGPGPVKETPALGRNIQEKKSAPKSRLPPKRTKASGKVHSTQPAASNGPEMSKPVTATTPVERPCRIAHAKENTYPTAAAQAQAKQKGLSITETDLRRGIEGTTKSRLSTPLRNIFRFR